MTQTEPMKILTIVGARPQFIKAAPVSRVLRATPGLREILVHTGQHYDPAMSQVFFDELDIPRPDHHLGVGSGSHGAQTGRMLEKIEAVLLEERPRWVLVYGDTNSTLAGALAATKLRIPVAHVEAGLRSFNRLMPEEINRVVTDCVAEVLFAPTPTAVANLTREGVAESKIRLIGDVMYDAALHFEAKAMRSSKILDLLGLRPGGYVLLTLHRAETTDDDARLRLLVDGLALVAQHWPIVFPMHPRTRNALGRAHVLHRVERNFRAIDPVGYLDMIMLEKHARLIATDSGGVQKEAFYFRVPCATLRSETEWVELVESGWNQLVVPREAEALARQLLAALEAGRPAEPSGPLYGGGRAADAVAMFFSEEFDRLQAGANPEAGNGRPGSAALAQAPEPGRE